ncbi:MAG TPA: dihydrolipoyl dehydrogenase [Usitatibacteraceae bacterium]|nr:dihydrolipoyl dehydrogenase [Usitatibacteraceae bacterium]
MKFVTVDVAVIGAGTAGLAAYRAARARGARAVIIESGPHGTTCARVGCMPSKLLIAAAEASHAIDAAPGFGVHVDGAKRVDGREVMDRVRRERDRFVGFVVEGVGRIPADDRIEGRARFVDRRTLEVDGHTRVTARAIVIATGSRPAIPAMLAAAGDRLVVNDDVFSWETLPRSVAVFGPGVIGLELGQALSRLGVRVVVLGRGGRVGPLTDPVVRDAFLEAISDGLYVDPDAHVKRVARITEGVEVEYTRVDGTVRVESFDWLLAATGRRPNVDGLGLEALGLELDANGVPGFDPATLRVGDTNLFIAGDAANFIPLLHEAADEGRIAGDNAASLPETTPGHRRMPLAIVFTDPQVAIVGPGFDKLAPGTFEAGEVSFADQGRSRVMLRNRGHLRVYADRATGRFLGAEMAGPAAEHIGHLLAWAAANRMTVASMLEMPFYHPVVEEGLRTALRDLDAKLRSPQAIAA